MLRCHHFLCCSTLLELSILTKDILDTKSSFDQILIISHNLRTMLKLSRPICIQRHRLLWGTKRCTISNRLWGKSTSIWRSLWLSALQAIYPQWISMCIRYFPLTSLYYTDTQQWFISDLADASPHIGYLAKRIMESIKSTQDAYHMSWTRHMLFVIPVQRFHLYRC